ncbi:hypothetical protein RDWZM_003726 [Blomia tropicalis]|uniref:Protein kinase domain-containing protein n=1 Tax=Blomia tropicalis TaxID=40697 RepID=A0A9Q0MG06_BLOTA|nr:CBL-interacting protein kinase [Blomia tropicalis]KAJ6225181.1 hypothetical protein RDWZM_003726 [Blomia tropicalis]
MSQLKPTATSGASSPTTSQATSTSPQTTGTPPKQDQTVSIETPLKLLNKGYKFIKVIGQGGFGRIYLVQSSQFGEVACKQFDFAKLEPGWIANCLSNELRIMLSIRHENILHALHVERYPTEAFLFMPYAPNGTMTRLIYRRRMKPLQEMVAKRYFSDLLNGIDYLHTNRIVHRDIKCDNLLLNSQDRLWITDFGFATIVPPPPPPAPPSTQPQSTTTKTSTPKSKIINSDGVEKEDSIMLTFDPLFTETVLGSKDYMAPELLAIAIDLHRSKTMRNNGPDYQYDARAVDIFACGVCLFEMINRDRPYCSRFFKSTDTNNNSKRMNSNQPNRSLKVDSQNIREDIFFRQIERSYHFNPSITISMCCIELIHQCLNPFWTYRPSARLILNSNWLQSHESSLDLLQGAKGSAFQSGKQVPSGENNSKICSYIGKASPTIYNYNPNKTLKTQFMESIKELIKHKK